MNQLVITFLLMCGSAYCFYVGIKSIIDALSAISLMRAYNNKIKKWPKLIAVITKLGYGLDYEYPYVLPDLTNIKGELAKEAALIEFQDSQLDALADIAAFGHVYIGYIYEKDGKQWQARSIGPYVSDKDLDLLYKIKVGSKVNVYVNPDDSAEAYLRVGTKKELDDQANQMLLGNIQYIAYGIATGALSYLSITVDFPF